jgi:hydroxymethylbilane synthase
LYHVNAGLLVRNHIMGKSLTIGSRGSQLALWQARHIEARLQSLGIATRLEIIKTTGDKITDVPLAQVGGKGLFTKEIEEALLDGRIDLAVHSLKDLPTVLPDGLAIAAIPERELPFDALVGVPLANLKPGARVGTSSLRRAAQLKRLRPDLLIENIRGNLDTRLRKLDEGLYEAIVLAAAGLRRLGWGERIAELFAPEIMCPAVGQGALAIETLVSSEAYAICRQLDHEPTRIAVSAERALLAALGGGCQVPIGAHAEVYGGRIRLRALIAHPDGSDVVVLVDEASSENAAELGTEMALRLLEGGGREFLRAAYGEALPLAGRRVVVTRAADQAGTLSESLRRMGAQVVELPVVAFAPPDDWSQVDLALAALDQYDWLVFTSANGVRFFFDRARQTGVPVGKIRAKICAVGPATAAAVENYTLAVHLMPHDYVGAALADALLKQGVAGQRVLWARAAVARETVPESLRQAGVEVDTVAVYRTIAPPGLEAQARKIFGESKPDWVTFTSGSTVRNLLAAVGAEALAGIRCASIGAVTTEAALRHGLTIAAEANPSTAEGLADAIARAEI